MTKTCNVCECPDGDHYDWCTPQARAAQPPSKDQLEAAFNRAVNLLGELFAWKRRQGSVGEYYELKFSGDSFFKVNAAMANLGVAIRQYSAHEPESEQPPATHGRQRLGEIPAATSTVGESREAGEAAGGCSAQPPPLAPLADEDGPGEEDGPWAKDWADRTSQPPGLRQIGVKHKADRAEYIWWATPEEGTPIYVRTGSAPPPAVHLVAVRDVMAQIRQGNYELALWLLEGIERAGSTKRAKCQHDLLLPNPTVTVDEKDPFSAHCDACGYKWKTAGTTFRASSGEEVKP